ncbi:MAG: hemin-degrading factor [Saprospiraceae bacterium]|nr:hemin-degrading factor [Saprospiraceae bacterium]
MINQEYLLQQVEQLKKSEPRLRTRNLAERLEISEAELISLYVGQHVTRLQGDWKELLKALKDMGYVMALTRNEHCVHERKGVYDNITFYEGSHNMGVAVNPDIDLRFFMNEWVYAFAVEMERPKGPKLYAFQFFNSRGEAVHKVYSTPKSDLEAYHRIVDAYKAAEQEPIADIDKSPYPESEEKPDSEIDVEGFQQAWRDLKDTHHFFGMLKKFGVSRTQALRLAPEGFCESLDNQSVVRMLETAAQREVPIMCFLHSRGCVQIHTGPVKNLKVFGDWYNVMDPKFNLHLNMNAVCESWIVRKPTEDGVVTSLELFDQDGQLIVYFFGARKPGIPELESWRKVLTDIQLQNETITAI